VPKVRLAQEASENPVTLDEAELRVAMGLPPA
jgi:hypothetical protein